MHGTACDKESLIKRINACKQCPHFGVIERPPGALYRLPTLPMRERATASSVLQMPGQAAQMVRLPTTKGNEIGIRFLTVFGSAIVSIMAGMVWTGIQIQNELAINTDEVKHLNDRMDRMNVKFDGWISDQMKLLQTELDAEKARHVDKK